MEYKGEDASNEQASKLERLKDTTVVAFPEFGQADGKAFLTFRMHNVCSTFKLGRTFTDEQLVDLAKPGACRNFSNEGQKVTRNDYPPEFLFGSYVVGHHPCATSQVQRHLVQEWC